VGGRVVRVSPLSGAEDVLLAEAVSSDTVLAMTLAERLACDLEGAPIDWGQVAVTDLDAFIVFLRRMLIGDWIRSDAACQAKGCEQRIDIAFSAGQFLDHHRPSFRASSHRAWSLRPGQEAGWYHLAPLDAGEASLDGGVDFRLPTPNDQLAVSGRPGADVELARRCVQPADAPLRLRRKAEVVMEAMSPCLSGDIQARCPECGAATALYFDARRFCLCELLGRAASIYADVDVLARRYHWSENEILSLPRSRRVAYVDLALQAGSN